MKKILFFGLILISTITFSQSPQFLNYQGVARDASGTIINSGNIGIRFEIWRTSPSGTKVYQEEISSAPSAAGVFTAAIGNGTANIGTFASINWANGPYFIVVGIDPTGGTTFSTVGTSQLLSVPYALYAETAGNTQTVSISGPNVIGTYPNYTITPTAPAAGSGISISSGSIINTAQNQTVYINPSGVANVLGTYPNYTVDVPNPGINYNTGTQVLTLTQGTAVSTATISSTSTTVSIVGAGVSGVYPSYTITPPPAASITAGNTNITVSGTGPGFTVSSTPTLALVGAALSISNGNTVTLPTGTTYTNGADIALISGTIITNTAPDKTVTIANGTNVTVNSAYPNFTINSTPSLSIAGNTLSITGGTSVVLPGPPVLTASTGISIVGGTITNTAPNQTVNVSGPGVIGSYPNYTVTSAPQTTVTQGNNIIVNGTSPSYTVSAPTYSLNFSNSSTGILTNGLNTYVVSLPQPTLTLSGVNSNVITAGSNSVTISTYTAGSGLTLSGTAPNFTLSTSSTGTNTGWKTLGNTGTIDGTNFIGTTDNIPFNIRVNNQKAGRIEAGSATANTFFGYQSGSVNTGSNNTATGYQALFSNTSGSWNTANGALALYNNTTGNNNTANGMHALYFNSTGNQNTATGYTALYNNTTGFGNTANGVNALLSNTTGTANTATGLQALYYNTIGNGNTANGYQALLNTTGSLNTAAGYKSLYANTTGSLNSAFGENALVNNTTGYFNSSFGAESMLNHSNGIANTGLGYQAMYWNNGNYNVGAGFGVLQNNLTGGSNTALGTTAGYNSTGSGNVFIGFAAGYSAAGSNQLYIANNSAAIPLIYGDFSSGKIGLGTTAPSEHLNLMGPAGSFERIKVESPGNSGTSELILQTDNSTTNTFQLMKGASGTGGTTAGIPLANLSHIFAGATAGGMLLQVVSSNPMYFATANLERMRITAAGNVGIGTIAPTTLLHVNSATPGAVRIVDNTQADGKVLTSDATGLATWQKGSYYTFIYPNANSVASPGAAPVMVPSMSYTFAKTEAKTTIEADFNGHMTVGGMPFGSAIIVELRINGINGDSFSGRTIYWQGGPNPLNIVMKGIFQFLPIGTHTVEIWVSSSGGPPTGSVFINPGNWADQIIIKETH